MKKLVAIVSLVIYSGLLMGMGYRPNRKARRQAAVLLVHVCKKDIRDPSYLTGSLADPITTPRLTESREYPYLRRDAEGILQWNGSEKLPYSPQDRFNEFNDRVDTIKVEDVSDWTRYHSFLICQKHAQVKVIDKYTLRIKMGERRWREQCYRVLALGRCYIKVFNVSHDKKGKSYTDFPFIF